MLASRDSHFRPGEQGRRPRSATSTTTGAGLFGFDAVKFLVVLVLLSGAAVVALPGQPAAGLTEPRVVILTNDDFRFGTYIIDQPGTYRLGGDISFNPNSLDTLQAIVDTGVDPLTLGLEQPIDAYQSGFPLVPQLVSGGN